VRQHHDYISGRHHYWTHFSFGLLVGAGLGAWIGIESFESGWPTVLLSVILAFSVAYSCGRWGECAWDRIADSFRRYWWIP
jgi:hypothetical protein